jgi:CubicO group peptidase (beta-lactamase class C family)
MRLFWLLYAVAGFAQVSIDPNNFQRALDGLPALAQRAINSSGVPGMSIAVVYNGTIQYTGGFGVRLVGGNASVDADTVFPLASVSKPICSTIVAAIVSATNLTFDTAINTPDVLGAFSDPWISNQVTVADCLSHRTGLYGEAGDDLELLGYDRDAILSRLQYMPPAGPFRASYHYSNYGITLGGSRAAEAANMTWEDAAERYLYSPLSMSSTSSRYSDFLSRSNRAALHIPASTSTNTTIAANANTTAWFATPARNPDPQSPAGGVTSSANDLAKWVQLHLSLGMLPNTSTQLITQSALNTTRTPQIVRGLNPTTNTTGFYGLGWNVDYDSTGQVYVDHAGAFSQGARTLVKLNVDLGLGIVVLANCFPTGWPEGIADTFFDIALLGAARRDWVTVWNGLYQQLSAGMASTEFDNQPPADATPMLALDAYAGTYENAYVGRVTIEGPSNSSTAMSDADRTETALVMSFPDDSNASFPLMHWDRDTFVLNLAPEQGGQGSAVTFSIGADGNASAVVVEMLNGNGGGVLMRL